MVVPDVELVMKRPGNGKSNKVGHEERQKKKLNTGNGAGLVKGQGPAKKQKTLIHIGNRKLGISPKTFLVFDAHSTVFKRKLEKEL